MNQKSYLVKTIFGKTVQGEASYSGTVVSFLRFSGCNMWSGKPETKPQSICRFCDTDFYGGTRVTKGDINSALRQVAGKSNRVVISGGEPALQFDEELGKFLVAEGWELHMETNGTHAVNGIEHITHVTVSPKVAVEKIKTQRIDDLKVLYPPIAPEITPEKMATAFAGKYWLQPVWDDNYEQNLQATIAYCIENPQWNISMQTHKYMGVK